MKVIGMVRFIRRWQGIAIGAFLLVTAAFQPASATVDQLLRISGNQSGRIFEGIGALSGGGSTHLIYDYPEPQRSQILDYLFKPSYGASLQHLRMGLGGDSNQGIGSEPSHMHTRGIVNMHVGHEMWFAMEAKKRNPNITLSLVQGSTRAWVGDGDYFSQDNIDYIVEFLLGAKREYGLAIDYISATINEPRIVKKRVDWEWVKPLARAVNSRGLVTRCCPTAD